MEQRNHFKNGDSPKTHSSRTNFRIRQMFSNYSKVVTMIVISAMYSVCAVNAQTEPNSKQTTNTPLIVIDGIELGDVKNISPESIESITVLKDQSAVKIYGEKGKNGVVVISTKRNQSEKVEGKVDASLKIDSPLIVVDGIEFGDIKSISPENIESITVLKDQSAVKVYGEKGKNGVVIISTKK